MKGNIAELLRSIAIPLMVGILAALLTNGSREIFESLVQPPLSPPG